MWFFVYADSIYLVFHIFFKIVRKQIYKSNFGVSKSVDETLVYFFSRIFKTQIDRIDFVGYDN
jgi:hypothetical protein